MKHADDPVDHESFMQLAEVCHKTAELLRETRKDVQSLRTQVGWLKLACLAMFFVIVCMYIAIAFK